MVSFLALAGFGLFAMGHDAGHGNGWCVIANPQGALCSGENAFAIVRSHVEAFTSVLTAIFDSFGAQAALFIVTMFAALAGIRIFVRAGIFLASKIAFSFSRQAHIPFSIPSEQELRQWLARRTNSPSKR
ncbi:MAG: hypothetical protein UX24_C0029G0005 [Candidatus Giovannonibacteria bacterium GW2011_GWB1_45_9b]|nr:MAG: hypothetical protein UX24_C0029G0005 [Candidatus Giovannonibacteria bacterium GW2011_GWB1_45_9b]KKU69786.1 MAG: hypothetical protein UX94_C0016G0005 [Parcubacteria group bacterium GW2011_GWA2_47_21]